MASANVIQLRQFLAEKFPGLRTRADELIACAPASWSTGWQQLDDALQGGFPKGALSEITAGHRGSGSALLMHHFLKHAAREEKMAALVDAADCFDATQVEEPVLSRLLWVRCRSAQESLKAADLLLRDGNLPLVLLDLVSAPADQLRKIPATTWYRFQRLVEQTSLVALVFTPMPMVAPARIRLTLRSRFSLGAQQAPESDLLHDLQWEISDSRQLREAERRLRTA